MRKAMLALAVLGLAVAGATNAAAQDPCEPYCDETELSYEGTDLSLDVTAAAAPLFVTMAVLLVSPRRAPADGA